MMQRCRIGGLLALTLSGAASAGDTGWYTLLGATLSQADISAADYKAALEATGATNVVATVDNSDSGWTLMGGYKFSRHLAMEAGYVDLGKQIADATYAQLGSPVHAETRLQAFQLDVVASYPLNRWLALDGKLGWYAWTSDSQVSNAIASQTTRDRGNNVVFGVGASVKLVDPLDLRVGWDRYNDADGTDVDLYSLALLVNEF